MVDERVPVRASNRQGVRAGVALVGFMGAGKSTVGRELAQRLGWQFLDLDELIEEREQRKIDDIFRRDGEPVFRRLECAAVRDATQSAANGPVVLALGGGAFIDPAVRSCLEEAQIPAIFLDAPVAELFRRSEQPGANRPLRRHLEQFRQLYERRRPEYLKAAICVETQGKVIASVAQEIISELNLVPFSGACD
jgi:shikimate kinase